MDNENSLWYIGVVGIGKKTFQLNDTLHCRYTSFHLDGQLTIFFLLFRGTDLLSRHVFRFLPWKLLDYIGERCQMHTQSHSTSAVGLRERYALSADALPGQVPV
jgi:hypothetical protein